MSCPPSFKLSFESVILDPDDVRILETGQWFNDKLLTFIGEYLMKLVNHQSSEHKEIHVFTPPETEMIRHANNEEEVAMYFGMLGCHEVPLAAWIVNNNQDVTRANGGSHWSLLIFDRKTDQFYHFDSSAGYNHHIAESLMKKAQNLVKQQRPQQRLGRSECLQQKNSSDCGLHVAQFLATLCEEKDVETIGAVEQIQKTREYWRDLILNF